MEYVPVLLLRGKTGLLYLASRTGKKKKKRWGGGWLSLEGAHVFLTFAFCRDLTRRVSTGE